MTFESANTICASLIFCFQLYNMVLKLRKRKPNLGPSMFGNFPDTAAIGLFFSNIFLRILNRTDAVILVVALLY